MPKYKTQNNTPNFPRHVNEYYSATEQLLALKSLFIEKGQGSPLIFQQEQTKDVSLDQFTKEKNSLIDQSKTLLDGIGKNIEGLLEEKAIIETKLDPKKNVEDKIIKPWFVNNFFSSKRKKDSATQPLLLDQDTDERLLNLKRSLGEIAGELSQLKEAVQDVMKSIPEDYGLSELVQEKDGKKDIKNFNYFIQQRFSKFDVGKKYSGRIRPIENWYNESDMPDAEKMQIYVPLETDIEVSKKILRDTVGAIHNAATMLNEFKDNISKNISNLDNNNDNRPESRFSQ